MTTIIGRAVPSDSHASTPPHAAVIAIWIKKNSPDAVPAIVVYGCITANWQAGMAIPTAIITKNIGTTSAATDVGAIAPPIHNTMALARLTPAAAAMTESAFQRVPVRANRFEPIR